jgi:cytochrome c oxidase subunit 2
MITMMLQGAPMNALDPQAPHAEWIASWFWLSFWIGLASFVMFVGLGAFGLVRAHRRERRGEVNELTPRTGRNLVVWGGVVVPLVLILIVLVASTLVDRSMARTGRAGDPLTIEIRGHKFWWEIKYRDPLNPHREFTTANELHLPVGKPVRLLLESADVIHSFWVPSLNGKVDLIPGRTNDIVLQLREAGIYRGQCAEFCGTQHAKMALMLIGHRESDFESWWALQLISHDTVGDVRAARGHQVFMRNGCGTCHTIRGTSAKGTVAPDLTHIGSRKTIAAASLPNTRGHLAGWISDPQAIKPGSYMPSIPLRGEDLQALLDYLHSLR